MKKLLIVLIAILSLSICLLGCSKKGESESTSSGAPVVDVEEKEEQEHIAFANSSISVELYESVVLVVTGTNGQTLTWRSANPERLTVDQNGVVYAKMAGTVLVYASNGTEEISCTVTIIDGGYIPMLKVSVPAEFRLQVGDDYNLTPYITYNGAKYYNAEYTYTATGCVSVSADGVITANSVGTGVVTVTAQWNGVQSETLIVDIEVSVIE